jgi:hypothetical protein
MYLVLAMSKKNGCVEYIHVKQQYTSTLTQLQRQRT